METVADFILGGGSKITADGDCSHEIKRRLLLGRKVMTNLDNILKSRDITLPTKVCLVKAILMKVKVEGEKVGLRLNIQKTKIMASGPISSWEIDGKQWKQCHALFFGVPKSLQIVIAAMKLKNAYSLEGKV